MNWRINQPLIAMRKSSLFEAGDKFKVEGVVRNHCKCGGYKIDVGIRKFHNNVLCLTCGTQIVENTDVCYHHESFFAAIEEKGSSLIETFLNPINNN